MTKIEIIDVLEKSIHYWEQETAISKDEKNKSGMRMMVAEMQDCLKCVAAASENNEYLPYGLKVQINKFLSKSQQLC